MPSLLHPSTTNTHATQAYVAFVLTSQTVPIVLDAPCERMVKYNDFPAFQGIPDIIDVTPTAGRDTTSTTITI
jgi:hypothetical protein